MSEEKQEEKVKTPIDFSHIGGKKVGHPVTVKLEKPIDFSSIGGVCVRKASDNPMFNPKPEESVEKEGDAHQKRG